MLVKDNLHHFNSEQDQEYPLVTLMVAFGIYSPDSATYIGNLDLWRTELGDKPCFLAHRNGHTVVVIAPTHEPVTHLISALDRKIQAL